MISSPSHPQSIRPLIERINQAVIKSSADSVSPIFASEGTRYDLIAVAEGLLFAVRTPEENLFAIAQQVRSTYFAVKYTFKIADISLAPSQHRMRPYAVLLHWASLMLCRLTAVHAA
jgi:hypothetical protein